MSAAKKSIRTKRKTDHYARQHAASIQGLSGQFIALMEMIREPLIVLDRELCAVAVNQAFSRTFDVLTQAAVGRTIFEIGDGEWNTPRLRQFLEQVLTCDECVELDYEFPAAGHRHVLLSARQILANDDFRMIFVSIHDLTEQAETRKALEASEARYRAIVQDQTELVCRYLPDGTLTFFNDAFCRYFGYQPEELLRHNCYELISDAGDREAVQEYLAGFGREEPVRTFTRRMAAPGSPWRQWVTRAFFDEEGRIVEFQSAGRDISELKEGEAALLLYQKELRALTAKLISAQEESSKLLARELHDVFSQKLAVLGMEITELEQKMSESPAALGPRLRQIGEQISRMAKDIHQISRQLHPAILDDLGLAAALKNECLAFSEQYGVPVEFAPEDVQVTPAEDVSLCLYRVAQESLRNIGKHATASAVSVALTTDGEAVTLVIEDTGDGFELEEVRGKGGLGIVSMDERVRLVGGAFSIQSEPGKGTRVEVRVPLIRSEA